MSINDSNETPLALHPLPIFLRGDGVVVIGDIGSSQLEIAAGKAVQVEFGNDTAVGMLRIENVAKSNAEVAKRSRTRAAEIARKPQLRLVTEETFGHVTGGGALPGAPVSASGGRLHGEVLPYDGKHSVTVPVEFSSTIHFAPDEFDQSVVDEYSNYETVRSVAVHRDADGGGRIVITYR